jgi:superfamily II DNA or RNA helicase
LISEGLDVPGVVAAILLRPTKSLALFLQQVGRALRPAPGKTKALILDHAGNTLRHGLPDEPREWSLDGRAKKHGHAPLCRCEECGALNPISAEHCHECGTYFPDQRSPTKRARIEVSSRLVEVDRLQAMSYRAAIRWAGGDRARLEMVAMARGYKPGWVWHRMQELLQGGEL